MNKYGEMMGNLAMAVVGFTLGLLLGVFSGDTTVGVVPILPCDMERTSDNAEDDLCTMWKVTENKWVIGPLSERP